MNRILLKAVKVINRSSAYNNKVVDIAIDNGVVENIAEANSVSPQGFDQVFEATGACVSSGWIDGLSFTGDPGFEHKENIESLAAAAHAGGYTNVLCNPLTQPVIDNKAQVEYLKSKSQNLAIALSPIACITAQNNGEDMVEMYDCYLSGAKVFYDGKSQLSAKMLLKALQYTSQFGATVMLSPNNQSLSKNGQVNEGEASINTGLVGIPDMAEEIHLAQCIDVLRYAGGRLHVVGISTAKSIELIKAAKAEGLAITVSVIAHQLAFSEAVVNDFDTNFKVFPPFRSKENVKSVFKGFADGVIDAVVSDHLPMDTEEKFLEFDLAQFGAIGVQTSFAVANTQLSHVLDTNKIIELFTTGPAKAFGLETYSIEKGKPANFSIFNPSLEWEFTPEQNLSLSNNSPFFGEKLKGKALATVCKGQLHVCA